MMSLGRILLVTDRRVIPLQLLQLLKAPFFPNNACMKKRKDRPKSWRGSLYSNHLCLIFLSSRNIRAGYFS